MELECLSWVLTLGRPNSELPDVNTFGERPSVEYYSWFEGTSDPVFSTGGAISYGNQGEDAFFWTATVVNNDYPLLVNVDKDNKVTRLQAITDKITLNRAKHTLPYGYIVIPFKEKDLITSIEVALYRHAQEQNSSIPGFKYINTNLSIFLTRTEYEVLAKVCEGITNKAIAETLYVSINIIKTNIKNLLTKLDVPDRSSSIAKIKSL